jgi:two-component system cell cycle response regulator
MKIMLVDDEPDQRQVLSMLLSLEGFEVVTSDNGAHALELLGTEPHPEVVITDQMMPHMSGTQLARAIKADARTAHIPVVLLSAVTHAVEDVWDEKLTKPVSADALLAAIKRLVGKGA